MKSAKLGKLWDSLHSSFWFVPTLMLVMALGLSFVTIGIDQRREANIIEQLGWTLSPVKKSGILRYGSQLDFY